MKGLQIGSYLIERKLGEGGMGVVYVGVDLRLGRRAAIKQLLPELSGQREVIERFFNEAKAAANINHPGIVEIYEVGWHVDGSAYFAMKLLEGDSLARRMRTGPMPLAVACSFARQLASALAAAHAGGIVHRDLKPDNVMLVRDDEIALGERATVLDFGIAKLSTDQPISYKTRSGSMMGTPSYMSPEQCRGAGDVDHRTDVYAVGCMLFEMLAGRPPFVGAGAGEVLGMHQFVAPPALRGLRGDVPPELEAIVMRCLAKHPDQRYQQMTDLIAALQQASRGGALDIASPPSISASHLVVPTIDPVTVPPAPSTLTSGRGALVTPQPPVRGRRLVFGLLGSGIVLAVVAIIAVVAASPGGSTHPGAQSTLSETVHVQAPPPSPARPDPAPAAVPAPEVAPSAVPAPAAAPSAVPTPAVPTPAVPTPAVAPVAVVTPTVSPSPARPPAAAPPAVAAPDVASVAVPKRRAAPAANTTPPASSTLSDDERADNELLLSEADAALHKENWQAARGFAHRVLDRDPGNAKAKQLDDRAVSEMANEVIYQALMQQLAEQQLPAALVSYRKIPKTSVYHALAQQATEQARKQPHR